MFESLLTIFAVGSVAFWIIVILTSIVFIASIENNHYFIPTAIIILCLGLYWGSISALSWNVILCWGIGYIIIGMLWSIFRWYKFTISILKISSNYTLENSDSKNRYISRVMEDVSVNNNKSRIIGWMVLWPWSVGWYLTSNFFETIYDNLWVIYEKISNNVIDKAKQSVKIDELIEKDKKV